MNWKCPQDIFMFCNGIPDWSKEPIQVTKQDGKPGDWLGGICKLDKSTCGRIIKFTDLVKEDPRLKNSKLVETIIPIDNADRPEKKTTGKSAKTKKLEAELAQGNLFG